MNTSVDLEEIRGVHHTQFLKAIIGRRAGTLSVEGGQF